MSLQGMGITLKTENLDAVQYVPNPMWPKNLLMNPFNGLQHISNGNGIMAAQQPAPQSIMVPNFNQGHAFAFNNDMVNFELNKKRKLQEHSFGNSSMNDIPRVAREEDPLKKKFKKKGISNYSPAELQEALDMVNTQHVSLPEASKKYNIPLSTLRRYSLSSFANGSHKVSVTRVISSGSGNRISGSRERVLSDIEEAHIVTVLSKMSKAGKYVSTADVKSTVKHLLDESNRFGFQDENKPTAGWVQRFKKRHPNVTIKACIYPIKQLAPKSQEDVKEWYKDLSIYLLTDWKLAPDQVFNQDNANRIFNVDEISIGLNKKQDLVDEAMPGSKFEENMCDVTVLTAVSAAGEFLQPLIIEKGDSSGEFEDDMMPFDQTSFGISFSRSGKLDCDILLRWLQAFDRELTEKGIQKPIVLFLDDAISHFHISVFSYALDNDIILLCAQSPNFQPIAAELNERVNEEYRKFSKEYYKTERIPVTMDSFPEIFLKSWEIVAEKENTSEKITKSFAHFGLLPFSPDALAFEDLPLFYDESIMKSLTKNEKAAIAKAQQTPKEPKAKKTVAPRTSPIVEINVKSPEKLVVTSPKLLPTVKITKLESQIDMDKLNLSPECLKQNPTIKLDSNKSPIIVSENSKQSFNVEIRTPSPKKKVTTEASSNLKDSQLSFERLEGRRDGILKCLDLMESFIPSDIINVWRNRNEDIKSSSEIPYCMWKTVKKMYTNTDTQVKRKNKSSR